MCCRRKFKFNLQDIPDFGKINTEHLYLPLNRCHLLLVQDGIACPANQPFGLNDDSNLGIKDAGDGNRNGGGAEKN